MFSIFHSEKENRQGIVQVFKRGFNAQAYINRLHANDLKTGINAVVGVMSASKHVFDKSLADGAHCILIDKCCFRQRRDCVRMSVDRFQPLEFLMSAGMPHDRLREFDVIVKKTSKQRGEHVLITGSSQKYCDWHELGDVTAYVQSIVNEIKTYTSRPIIYRPKPSFKDAAPVEGAAFSHDEHRRFQDDLSLAWAVVGFGSNAMLESLINGVPAFNVGPRSVVWPLCNLNLADLDKPSMPHRDALTQYVANISYCNWSLKEIVSGKALDSILEQMKVLNVPESELREMRRHARSASCDV